MKTNYQFHSWLLISNEFSYKGPCMRMFIDFCQVKTRRMSGHHHRGSGWRNYMTDVYQGLERHTATRINLENVVLSEKKNKKVSK